MVVSLWNLTGTSAAVLPRYLPNFRAIGKVWTRISRLRDFTRSCSKTSYRLVNRGYGYSVLVEDKPAAVPAPIGTQGAVQYPIRRLIVRSCEVSNQRDLHLESSDHSEIWQTPRQHDCQWACQISKRCDNSNYQSRGFRDFTRSCDKLSYWILKWGPDDCQLLSTVALVANLIEVLIEREPFSSKNLNIHNLGIIHHRISVIWIECFDNFPL